ECRTCRRCRASPRATSPACRRATRRLAARPPWARSARRTSRRPATSARPRRPRARRTAGNITACGEYQHRSTAKAPSACGGSLAAVDSVLVARPANFDLALELARPGFTPGARDAPALVELIARGDEPAATRAGPALAGLR